MSQKNQTHWLPEKINTEKGKPRRVGIEIELAGPPVKNMCQWVQKFYGGKIVEKTRFEFEVQDTEFGDFILELDSAYLKSLAEEQASSNETPSQLKSITTELLSKTSELLVPWEIVSPPIEFADLQKLTVLIDKLRENGALGTRYALHYAFGVHLNPELPSLETATIVNYLRAYFCLYNWMKDEENVDFSRQLTPYINHFDKTYIEKVIDTDYQPSQQQLIEDYLFYNPTRNRSMDMLPLFAHLDEQQVRKVIDDPRIKPRPTLHYRLPNCDIDNPEWNLDHPWRLWQEVEKLTNNLDKLALICGEYQKEIGRLTHPLDKQRWVKRVNSLLKNN